MNELIVLFDPAEAARFPWPADRAETYAEAAPVPAQRVPRPTERRARAPEPYLGMGLAAVFWFGGSSLLALTAVALDTLIQLTR